MRILARAALLLALLAASAPVTSTSAQAGSDVRVVSYNIKHGRGNDFQGGEYGMATLSRYPITSTRSIRLPDGNEPRVALAVEVRLPAAKPASEKYTFSSTEPEREIDFIFYAPASTFRTREVRVIDEPVASDHRPVLAVLAPPAAALSPEW